MTFRVKGFTTMELMVSLALGGVALGLAVPALASLAENAAVVGAHNDLRTAIGYSRTQAVQLATPVALCASSDLRHCSGTLDWATGWVAFTDRDGAAGVPDGSDRILRAWPGPGVDRVSISARVELADAIGVLRFNSLGATSPAGAAASYAVQPTACEPSQALRREILISPAGAVRAQRVECQ